MTHFAVLRHGFDVSKNPVRLGHRPEAAFWLKLRPGGGSAKPAAGDVVWLFSCEGSLKIRHLLYGWFRVHRVGTSDDASAATTLAGNEGTLFHTPLGPLEQQPWFLPFAETRPNFRDGEAVNAAPIADDLLAVLRNARCPMPAPAVVGAAR